MNNSKICFLIPSVKSGGIETYLLRFLNYLDGSMETTVMVRSNEKGELYEDYKKTGVTVIFKPLGYFNVSSMYWYYCFFKKEKFDTVCDFNANFAGIPIFLSKLAGVKKRIAFYRQGSDHFKKSMIRMFYNHLMNRLVYRFSTAIYANSLSGIKFFFPKEYTFDTRFKVIKNGVNINDFINTNPDKHELRERLGLPKEKYIIGHTGRFTEAKNHFFLLDVAAKLIAADHTIFFVLIGNDTDKLLPYINTLGILDNVTVLGYKSNIPDYLNAFDLFFFPSITEGQPNALIEAMISGLSIVASNIPPIIECLSQKDQYCLVDPYNLEEATKKLQEAMKDGDKYTLQQHAIENFDSKVQFKIFKDTL